MINFLNDIRNAENPISNNRKLINTIALLFFGIALGTFSKYLDFRQAELPSVLMAINGVLDIGNFLGRFAIWVLIALCISIYSNSAIRASINVLYSLLVWLQATICIQTILQDFSQEVMLLFGLDLQLFLHYWLLSAGMQEGKANWHLYCRL